MTKFVIHSNPINIFRTGLFWYPKFRHTNATCRHAAVSPSPSATTFQHAHVSLPLRQVVPGGMHVSLPFPVSQYLSACTCVSPLLCQPVPVGMYVSFPLCQPVHVGMHVSFPLCQPVPVGMHVSFPLGQPVPVGMHVSLSVSQYMPVCTCLSPSPSASKCWHARVSHPHRQQVNVGMHVSLTLPVSK